MLARMGSSERAASRGPVSMSSIRKRVLHLGAVPGGFVLCARDFSGF